jgi:HTH-type transcriptional regulator / antitoxin HipB
MYTRFVSLKGELLIMNNKEHLSVLDIPREYFILQVPKRMIADIIRERLKEKNLTYRQAAEVIEDFSYTQLSRVTSGSNYTIDTLLKTLDGLGLELEIKKKEMNTK